MKKLILKCILLLLIVGSLLYAGGTAYKQTNTYRNLERTEQTEIYNEMPENIDIAVFGASHGRDGFKYPPENMVMFNFSLSAQTPQYDAAMLRQFQDQLMPGALIVITVNYLSPYWTDSEESFQSKNPRYYRILSPENIVDVDLGRYWLKQLCPLLTQEPSEIITAFLTKPDLIPTIDEESGKNQLSTDKISDEQARILRSHWSLISPVYPEVNLTMWNALHEMLNLCQEKELQAVLVTPPYLEVYNACFPEGFYEVFLSRIEELAMKYGVSYLNYSHDPDFSERYDLYRNIDHLNLDGAAEFNKRFFADVQSLGLLI